MSATLHICIFSGAERELHAALSGQKQRPRGHRPRRPLNEGGGAARHVVAVVVILHVA